jgi:TonB family protein
LKDCGKIDKLIWLYPDISDADQIELDRHLKDCQECREAFEIAKTVKASSLNDQRVLSKIDSAKFDAAVLRTIRERKVSAAKPERFKEHYAMRMAFSFALAATVILFLVRSISDLSEIKLPSSTEPKNEEKNYSVLNLELKRPATLPSPSVPSLAADKGKEKKSVANEAPLEIAEAPKITKDIAPFSADALMPKMDTVNIPLSPEMPLAAVPIDTSGLSDSVSVGEFSLADASPSILGQSRAASKTDYYATPGSVQVGEAQSSVVVNVEKMPKAVKVVIPEYPVWAKKRGLSGSLTIRARVENDGTVKEAEVVSCDTPGLGFEEAALKAAKESVFTPASANGINLAVWIFYPVKFINKE